MKPKLTPPGSKRLKLKCDILLSHSAFKFNLRRYTKWHKGDNCGIGVDHTIYSRIEARSDHTRFFFFNT